MLGVLERACLASTPGLEPSLPCAAPHCRSHAGPIGGGAEGELTAVLQRLQSPGDATRAAAEGCFTTMVAANLPAAAAALAAEVACPWKPAHTRHIAAIILKNLLAGSYHVGQQQAPVAWLNSDIRAQRELRQSLLAGLCSGLRELGMACAQAVAQLYASPLPQEGCLDGLLPCLADLAMCREPSGADGLVAVQCALQCLAYVCEAAPGRLSKAEIDQVLTAAAGWLRCENADIGTRLAAAAALNGSLPLAGANFAQPRERDVLMWMLGHMASSPAPPLRRLGFEGLAEACMLHAAALGSQMGTVAELFAGVLRSGPPDAVAAAVDALRDICEEDAEARREELPHCHTLASQHLAAPVLPHLLPHLRPESGECLEEADEDLAAAVADCLGALANAVGDEVLAAVQPFAQAGIACDSDWRACVAAATAVGAVIGAVSEAAAMRLAGEYLPPVLAACGRLREPREKQAMLWSIDRIMAGLAAKPNAGAALFPATVERAIEVLRLSTREAPPIAELGCQALASTLAAARGLPSSPGESSSLLLPHFPGAVGALLSAGERIPTSDQGLSLQMAAFAAVRAAVVAAPDDCCPLLANLAAVLNQQARDTGRRIVLLASRAVSRAQAAYLRRLQELQAFLCSVLQEIFARVGQQGLDLRPRLPPCEDVMQTVESALENNAIVAAAEAVRLCGALVGLWGSQFCPYVPTLWRAGYRAASNASAAEDCDAALQVFHDICASPNAPILQPYRDILLDLVLQHLAAGATAPRTRASCIVLMADLATLYPAGAEAEIMPRCMPALAAATAICASVIGTPSCTLDGEEAWALQRAIMLTHTSILQGWSKPLVWSHLHSGADNSGPAAHLRELVRLMEGAFAGRQPPGQRPEALALLVTLLTTLADCVDAMGPAFERGGWHNALLMECAGCPELAAHVQAAQQVIFKAVHKME